LVAGRRLRLAVLAVVSFVGGLLEALSLYLIAEIALVLTQGKDALTLAAGMGRVSLETAILLSAILILARFACWVVVALAQARLVTDVLAEVRNQTVGTYLSASWPVQSVERDGHLQELVGMFAFQASAEMSALANMLAAGFSVVALLVISMLANAVATLVIAVAGTSFMVLMRPLRSANKRRSRWSAQAGMDYGTAVSEAASISQEIHVFGIADSMGAALDRHNERSRRATEATQRLVLLIPAVYRTVALLVVVGGVAIIDAVGVKDELGALGAVLLIGLRTLAYGSSLQTAYQTLHVNAPYLEEMLEAQRRYLSGPAPAVGDRVLDRIEDMGFDEVSFTYDGTRFALDRVSFRAGRGEIIGIVGPSGSGKSTLVQLLLRLREPSRGRLLVNGFGAEDFQSEDWARRIAFVPQDTHLFRGTVAENVRFFRPEVTREMIEGACRFAHLHDEIMAWPEGYQTEVGERGRQLSGGQSQRLTIARALVGDPDVVILDEPTSNLDVASEAAIREALTALSRRALIFIVAHRLSTLDTCSRIMVIQEGRLRGFDRPERLAKSSAFYETALRLSGLQ
jgi:ABC-type multidrug transport system fused ATPase/permease subunit